MILSKEEKAKALAMVIELIKRELKITVEIPTVSGISPRCVNDNERYCTMRYSSERGFEVSTVGTWVSPSEAVEYGAKLLNIAEACRKLNQLYTPLK